MSKIDSMTIKIGEKFSEFKAKIVELFKDRLTIPLIYQENDDELSYTNGKTSTGDVYETCEFLYAAARIKLGYDEYNPNNYFNCFDNFGDYTKRQHSGINVLGRYFSFKSEQDAAKGLPDDWYGDYALPKVMDVGFYSMCILDDKIGKRFEVGYTLHQNRKTVGVAGYSEKLGKHLPYYVTYLNRKLVFIDPISGQIDTVGFSKGIESIAIENGSVVVNGDVVVEVIDGEVKWHKEVDEVQRDFKEAEREVKRQSGKKVKETPWQTIALGPLVGEKTPRTIRAHSLVALMVYGISCMKWGLMECNSLMTVDHINAEHSCNRIDNLALLTRQSNDAKGSTQDDTYYFDYFTYFAPEAFSK